MKVSLPFPTEFHRFTAALHLSSFLNITSKPCAQLFKLSPDYCLLEINTKVSPSTVTMCDWEEFIFSCNCSVTKLKNYCHFARNAENHRCLSIQVLKKVWDVPDPCDNCVAAGWHARSLAQNAWSISQSYQYANGAPAGQGSDESRYTQGSQNPNNDRHH